MKILTLVPEEEAEQDLCLVQVVLEELGTERELQEMVVVEGVVLIILILLEVVVLEPMVKMDLEVQTPAMEVLLMHIHKSFQ